MKITRLVIKKWRNFENIELNISPEATLVALIGENGVGKSSILDIINSSAHRLGLSAGVDIARGDPFNDEHDLQVDVYINRNIEELIPPQIIEQFKTHGVTYDGELSIISEKNESTFTQKVLLKNYLDHPQSNSFASQIVEALRQKEDTYHLSLDADRSYPPKPLQTHEYAQSLDQDWNLVQYKKHRAYYSSRNKYDEWMKYCVGSEAKRATESYQQQRLALAKGSQPPEFIDHFSSYGKAVNSILGHLQFLGVDTKEKTLIFDSTGKTLSFNQLSGGEREIAFVIGQIERFELENGVLLIDEPELHLNPEMVRTWISYLRDTVKDGQTWIATHSMEAVEAAGLECTFVIERDPETKKVREVTTLSEKPALSILSAAVGSPAFSLAKKAFLFIEGDRQGVERDKFYRLFGLLSSISDVRFMEGGGCKEVERKVEACSQLAEFTEQQIHVGGIVDMDHRTQDEIERLQNKGLLVLPYHEIENAFLFPDALKYVIQNSGSEIDAYDLIQQASDKVAGKWIFGRAMYRSDVKIENYREISAFWSSLKWSEIDAVRLEGINSPQIVCENTSELVKYNTELTSAFNEYSSLRTSKHLWKTCEGKQVLSIIPRELGFAKQIALINNICAVLKPNKDYCETIFGLILAYVNRVKS